jgi:uncharacterized membrane protein (DUF4010 family)
VSTPIQLAAQIDAGVLRILLAGALGMFLRLEREWSQKSAGIRTFALVSLLAAVFTVTERDTLLVLGAVILGSVAVAAYTADWSEAVEMDLVSPFSLRGVLAFGGVFLLVVVVGSVASARFGTAGLYVTSALSGLVSSAGATTSAVLLYRGGAIDETTATLAILLATAASIVVKAAMTVPGPDRSFAGRVAIWIAVVLGGASALTVALVL